MKRRVYVKQDYGIESHWSDELEISVVLSDVSSETVLSTNVTKRVSIQFISKEISIVRTYNDELHICKVGTIIPESKEHFTCDRFSCGKVAKIVIHEGIDIKALQRKCKLEFICIACLPHSSQVEYDYDDKVSSFEVEHGDGHISVTRESENTYVAKIVNVVNPCRMNPGIERDCGDCHCMECPVYQGYEE